MSSVRAEVACLTTSSSSRRPRRRGRFAPGTTVLDAARRLGVDLDSVCGGRGICGRCQVEVSEGEHAKHAIVSAASHLSPVEPGRARVRRRQGPAAGRRLGCSALRRGRARDRRARRRARCTGRSCARRPTPIRSRSTRRAPLLRRGRGARPRLAVERSRPPARGARARVGADRARRHAHVARQAAADASGTGPWRSPSPCATHATVIAVWPGYHDRAYGIAVDIGSTTIAGHLCDLHTARSSRRPGG